MGVLRDRDFRRLFGAQAISMFGDRMVSVALAFAAGSGAGVDGSKPRTRRCRSAECALLTHIWR